MTSFTDCGTAARVSSTTTRIKTFIPVSTVEAFNLPQEYHPPQQGLRQKSSGVSPQVNPPQEYHPPQQGLRLSPLFLKARRFNSARVSSTTTRIKTWLPFFRDARYGPQEYHPPQQGLRLFLKRVSLGSQVSAARVSSTTTRIKTCAPPLPQACQPCR